MSSGLAATGTNLQVKDADALEDVDHTHGVFGSFRAMVSNRLASNGSEWAEIFQHMNR